MYEKCLTCKKLGDSCDGPNFMAMSTADLIAWCNARRKQLPGMTYDRIVEATGLSKGTVSGFFGGTHADYRLETIRPILKMLVGGEWDDNPCADPTANERAAYEERIKQQEHDKLWLEEKVKDLQTNNEELKTLVANTNARLTKDKDFLRGQITNRNKAITVLSVCLAACLLVIIGALVIDRLDPDKGFFWLRSWFGGSDGGVKQLLRGLT